jgi:hypothetical protein
LFLSRPADRSPTDDVNHFISAIVPLYGMRLFATNAVYHGAFTIFNGLLNGAATGMA